MNVNRFEKKWTRLNNREGGMNQMIRDYGEYQQAEFFLQLFPERRFTMEENDRVYKAFGMPASDIWDASTEIINTYEK